MTSFKKIAEEHSQVTRRFFLQLGAAGAALAGSPLAAGTGPQGEKLLASAIAEMEYLSALSTLKPGGRGKPPPYELPPETFPEVGLTPETWFLELSTDPESDSKVERSFTRKDGTAITYSDLMKLAEKSAVRYLHVLTCTNVPDPFHMCLWEGVPLRELIWKMGPQANVRRIYYYGYSVGDPAKGFRSSLPLGRVLEDPPGELPVMLAYKMNGQPIPPKLGGPVRLLVPGAYGNKSIKWLQYIVLTNDYQANDSYAKANNDVESPLKTQARFINVPSEVGTKTPFAITGLAQVGMSGLSKVQFCIQPDQQTAPSDDQKLSGADWKDAAILPPPQEWGEDLPGGKLPEIPRQMNPATGEPYVWPIRYAIVHWAALLPGLAQGKYEIFCRTIDANGIAQPMPRPLPRTGSNALQSKPLLVKG